jgi:hypothetical protein
MSPSRIDLDAIVIASPCSVPWESMVGDEKKRFCGQCRLPVHDLSQMTRKEAIKLLTRTDGNCCKRVWRRPDGRVITKDCRRVIDAIRRRARLVARIVASVAAGAFAALGLSGCGGSRVSDRASDDAPNAASKPPAPPANSDVKRPVTTPPDVENVTTGR